MKYRIEHDSMGEVQVPADRLWGAQTERSRQNFPIGVGLERMPEEIIRAFGVDHVLYGSDYPMWNPGHEAMRLRTLPLTESEKAKILYLNAKTLFNL